MFWHVFVTGVSVSMTATPAIGKSSALRTLFFKYTPAQFDPIVPGKSYMENFEEFILEKFDLLKATGKAKQLKNSL